MQDHGFIALHRKVFKNSLFKAEKPVTRLHAWLWILSEAAWCQKQVRVSRKLVTIERGQLATTIRTLAKTFGWHRSKVDRFLRLLRKEAMIRTRAGETVTETVGETPARSVITFLTVCNYGQYQNLSTGQDSQARQSPRHKPRRGEQQRLDLDEEIPPQPFNHSTKEKKEAEGRGGEAKRKNIRGVMGRNKPRHGQTSRKNGTIWIDNGSDEWPVYAEDYKAATGAYPLPQQYIGGSGRWFSITGEKKISRIEAKESLARARDEFSAQRRTA